MTYKIALIGEAYGAEEEKVRAPFVGSSGQELTRMLAEAGIHRADCFLSNVFNLRPENNDIEAICQKDKAGGFGPIKAGRYLRPEFFSELTRLQSELRAANPNIIILLGNTACWAILGDSGISKIRGTVTLSGDKTPVVLPGKKVIPTYHPAAILREWSLRPVTVLDLAKARRESEFPEIRRPERTAYLEPDLSDIEWFYQEHLKNARMIAIDIETYGNQITCIGFSHTAAGMTIPFVDQRKPSNSYWPSAELEVAAWHAVRKICALPNPKVFQNGLYDLNFMWHYGIKVENVAEDTMLLHHALQPESEKGLAFLGSVYTNEASWKLRFRQMTIKRDS